MKATQTTPAHLRVLRRCIVQPDGCLVFTGQLSHGGYGRVKVDRTPKPTHRVVYEALVGPVPDGLQMDHLCRNRACCNPAHLEPVTPRENIRRSNSLPGINGRKTQCLRGHALDGPNTYVTSIGGRVCRTCKDLRHRLAVERLAGTL